MGIKGSNIIFLNILRDAELGMLGSSLLHSIISGAKKKLLRTVFDYEKELYYFHSFFLSNSLHIFTNDIKNKKIWLKLYKIKLNNTSKEPYKKQQAFKRINKAAKNKRSDKTIIKKWFGKQM